MRYTPPSGWYYNYPKHKKPAVSLERKLNYKGEERLLAKEWYAQQLANYPDVLTVAQVCEVTGYQRHTILKWCSNVSNISAKPGGAMKSYAPPMKRPRKALQSAEFFGVKCSRPPPPGISAYSRAASAALRHGRRPGSNTVAACPGERPCRTPDRAGFPPRPPRSATFPARDQGAAPQSGNMMEKSRPRCHTGETIRWSTFSSSTYRHGYYI